MNTLFSFERNRHMRNPLRLVTLRAGLLALVAVGAFVSAGNATVVTLRSGNAPVGQPDPLNTFLAEPSGACGVGFGAAFTAADFAAAETGPNATVVNPISVWLPSLACDSTAKWISVNSNYGPVSTLFAQSFFIPAPCCIDHAKLTLCWAVDDWLGDLDTFTNGGAYLNGVPLGISGGNYAVETSASVDVSQILHCGKNTLYMYDRDKGCAVSGLLYSASIEYVECRTSANRATWGGIKSFYR